MDGAWLGLGLGLWLGLGLGLGSDLLADGLQGRPEGADGDFEVVAALSAGRGRGSLGVNRLDWPRHRLALLQPPALGEVHLVQLQLDRRRHVDRFRAALGLGLGLGLGLRDRVRVGPHWACDPSTHHP